MAEAWVYGRESESGKDGTGGVCRAQIPRAFVMLRSWDLNVVMRRENQRMEEESMCTSG